MKKLFLLLITIAAIVLTGCSRGDDNLLRAVPNDTELLARIDMKAAAKSIGYSWVDILKANTDIKLSDEVKGIDLSGTVYGFVTEDQGLSGAVIPVNDVEALRDYLTGNGLAVTETDGVFHVGDNAVFDAKRLVVASGERATSINLHSLLKQEAIDDDVEELNEQLETIEDPIGIAVDCEIIKKNAKSLAPVAVFALSSLPADIDDMYLLVGIDATDKTLVVSTSLATDESKAQDQLEAIKKKLHPIKDSKIPFVADEYLALAAFNLKGSDLKPYAAMLGGLETDALLDALNGLATLTVTGVDMEASLPAFTFTVQANDIACLDKLMNQLSGFGVKIKDEGHHNWTVDAGDGELMLVGAQGGFVFANFGNNMQRPKGNNTIALEDGTVAYINCYPARIPELAQYGIKEVEFYATDELATQTTITLNRTWKELIEGK